MRSLRESTHAVIDLGVILMIVIAFAAMMVISYIIWKLKDQLDPISVDNDALGTVTNITDGYDDALNLILVAITIFILALAISALLMLRGR